MSNHLPPSSPTARLSTLNENILRTVWRRRRTIASITALCLAAATIHLLSSRPTYAVSTQLYLERKNASGIPDRSQEFLHTQVALLQSSPVLHLAISRPDIKQLSEIATLPTPIIHIRQRLTAEVNNKNGLVTLTLKCFDPQQGAQLLNSIVDSYIGRQNEDGPLPAASVVVLEDPDPNVAPLAPRKIQVASLAVALGLVIGSAFALLQARADDRLYSAQDVTLAASVPIAATIPHDPLLRNADTLLPPAAPLRSLCTAIQYHPATQQTPTILVTSPTPNTGNTTVAVGLAKAFAASGEHTILLDFNRHHPEIAILFKSIAAPRLPQPLHDPLNSNHAAQHTPFPNLDMLSLASNGDNSSPPLAGNAFGILLRSLSERYARVVIDGPPFLSCADAHLAAATCSATLLVLRLGQSTRSDYANTLTAFNTLNTRLFGIVLNHAPGTSAISPPHPA